MYSHKNYNNEVLTDSTVTTLNGNIIEVYNYKYLQKIEKKTVKGKIIANYLVEDGSKYGKRILKIVYAGEGRSVTVNEEEKYICDTIIQESGHYLNCFVTVTNSSIVYKDKNGEIGNENAKKRSYYAKGLGLYSFKNELKDDSAHWYQGTNVD